jgi:DNA gyrase subunit A
MAENNKKDNNSLIKDRLSKTVIKDRSISGELKNSFMDYAMSVIVARALPDARDGLKPVHRRILFAANELGMTHNSQYKKSARLVGEVIGKYHPHGDSAVYETMVRMAQDFSLRYPLIDGHGNFGSIDGDSAAAMRYTEARLSKIASELLKDTEKQTVEFKENYDGSESEPVVLPSAFPNLMVNGSSGIAVGMATNMPPHNLSEVINGMLALTQNSEITCEGLMEYIKGPDFPTHGEIIGESGINSYMTTGKGTVIIRAKAEINQFENGKAEIIVTQMPYMVNKANLIEKIADLVSDKLIDGISDLRDESSIKGIRVVIETKRDAVAEVVLNQLYKMTQLQVSFGVNMLSLVKGQPKVLNVKQMLEVYLEHQVEIVNNRTKFELKKAEERFHVLEGLHIATTNIDKVIDIIKKSSSVESAQASLSREFNLSEIQTKAITDMRLARLTGLERDKIENEIHALRTEISYYKEILSSKSKQIEIIEKQLIAIRDNYGDDRRTEILYGLSSSIDDEDLIPITDIVVTMSRKGYVKRLPIDTYRTQNRGGVGVKATTLNEDDDLDQIMVTTTHTDVLFFTNAGKVYRIRGHEIPQGSRQSKGIPAINFLGVEKGERIMSMLPIDNYSEGFLFFVTADGIIKRTSVQEFELVRSNGKICITLKENDQLFSVLKTNGQEQVFIGSSNGNVCRFDENDVRSMGRTASGVIGMRFEENEKVIGVSSSKDGNYLLSIGEYGLGKMTQADEFRLTKRGAKGVTGLKINEKTGKLICTKLVNGNEDIMLITNQGQSIRIPLSQVRQSGRATSGVILMNLEEKQKIQSVAIFNQANPPIDNTNPNQEQ